MKISKIINSLKTFARSNESDPFVITDLHLILEDVLAICKNKFVSANVNFTYKAINPGVNIECHPSEIYQVLINLLNNSSDAIEQIQEKWINLDFSENEHSIQFKITDCGLGIPKLVQEKIFNTFFTTKEIGKGTGMGLSISKRIIESHNGTLDIDNSCKNTTFIITLPKLQTKANLTA
jgi:signal transduction histidine kinase